MEKTIIFEMPEKQARKFEKILDANLEILKRIEEESPEREKRIAQSRAETQAIKKEIRRQLAILSERDCRLDTAV